MSTGVGASTGTGVASLISFSLRASRFFSSVRRKTLMVVRKALCGLQSSAETGECSQTGQVVGRVDWPVRVRLCTDEAILQNLQVSQIAWSQHGRRNALTARRLQIAQRSLIGISSSERELENI